MKLKKKLVWPIALNAHSKAKSSALEKYAISIIKNAEPVDLDNEKVE